MQAVILAAGRGKRMEHLTNDLPKPMLSVCGKNLIEHKLDILPKDIDEVVIVIGYLGEKIQKYFGDNYKGKKIKYVSQGELLGTMSALIEAKPLLTGKFLVMMGDDIYGKEDLENALKNGWSILVEKVITPKKGAKVIKKNDGTISDIIERADLQPGDLNNAGMYVVGKEIFDYPLVQIGNGEYGLPQTLVKALKDFPIKIVEAKSWYQITSPEDVERVGKILKK